MGLLDFFTKGKSLKEPIDLGLLYCDVHSHFIPGIDDGAKTIEDTLLLLKGMQEMGYKKIITTPHVMSDYYRNTTEIILRGIDEVKEAALKEDIKLDISASAEYYLDSDFTNLVKNKDLLTFSNNYVLFEVSYLNPPDNIDSMIFMLQSEGYKPIIAHPERYPYWYDSFEKYEQLADRGVLLQLNINSLTGHYSPKTQQVAEKLIEKNLISFIGSDCHHLGHQNLMQKAVYSPYLKKLFDSGKLLNSTL